MKILIATLHYLSGVGGGVFASRAYINAFAAIFPNNVTLLYPSKPGYEISGIDKSVKLIPVQNTKSKISKGIDQICGNISLFTDVFKKIIQNKDFDIVVFDNSKCSYRLIDICHKAGIKVITIHHNYEIEYSRDNISGPLRPIQLYWIAKCERDAIRKSDLNLTLTEADRILLANAYNNGNSDNFNVIGTFESRDKERPIIEDVKKSEIKKFIITGNLSAKQTEDSLIPWIQAYYPILNEEFPESTLTLAGKNPGQKLLSIAKDNGIIVIPNPESMDPILKDADIYICPTDKGGGLKLRVMDGLRFGLPVICHKVSARGYEQFEANKSLLSYEDIKSFRKSCQNLKSLNIDKSSTQNLFTKLMGFSAGVERLEKAINLFEK